MQLLPETAETVAKEMGRPHDRSWLVRGAYNIELGAHYLASLLARFKGSLPLAVAAYNCGPEAVEKWTARATGLDIDVFVETIPYLETREYVVRVMSNYARYVYLAKGDAPSLDLTIPR
jgi:soluble lytic murein transglycosylase